MKISPKRFYQNRSVRSGISAENNRRAAGKRQNAGNAELIVKDYSDSDNTEQNRNYFQTGDALAGQMICGLPAIVVYSLVAEGDPRSFDWTWQAIICALYLSIFGTIAAFWLYYWLLSKIESTKAMMISLVTPLIAVIIGAITIGEQLPPQTALGGLLIVASIGLIVFRRNAKSVLATEVTEVGKTVRQDN